MVYSILEKMYKMLKKDNHLVLRFLQSKEKMKY